jgi:hypothetical protein
LAKQDAFKAQMLAARGVQFTDIQIELNLFYQAIEEHEQIKAGKKTAMQQLAENTPEWPIELMLRYPIEVEKSVAQASVLLAQKMVNAIAQRDCETIFEVASAVEFLRDFKPVTDNLRERLLGLRTVCEANLLKDGTANRWTIKEIAKLVQFQGKGKDLSRLRRVCRELNFPLVNSKT